MIEQKRRLPPPVYLVLTLVLMMAMNAYLPLARVIFPPVSYVGAVLVVVGTLMTGYSARLFALAGTPLIPFERTTTLITYGLYRFTRNPMYLGLVLIVLGVAVLQGSVGAFAPIPLFAWILQTTFVKGEERFLEQLFGARYLDYKRAVRRWL